MDEEKAESYRALYRVRPLLYHIGDIRLWIPIRQDGVVLWFVFIFVFFIFCYLIPIIAWIVPLDRTLIMLIGPIIAAYYSVKLDPAGKSVPKYLKDLLQFQFRPKWLIKWQVMRFSEQKHHIPFEDHAVPMYEEKQKRMAKSGMGVLEGFKGMYKVYCSCSCRLSFM